MSVSDRRLKVAEKIAEGMKGKEIAEQLGYVNRDSVYQAVANPGVKEQIAFHRDNLFHQSRIDRVKLLRELYQRATEPTGPIFDTLQGDGEFLNAANLKKLDDYQSRIIQQVEVEPTLVKQMVEGKAVTLTVSVIKKIRFHSPDSALKILSKAAGFEDGVLTFDPEQQGGPFRGLVIIPPRETIASAEGPPGNPI